MPHSLKVYIETYGCQMNEYDSELVASLLEQDSHRLVPTLDDADVVLVNTCAVRENAEQRVFAQLARYKKAKEARSGDMTIGILGCMSQHLKESITAAHPYVDLVCGPDQYRQLPAVIRDLTVSREQQYILINKDRTENYDQIYPARKTGVNAWVTVMRGCDNMCSFCIVPFTRGRERSRSIASVVEECVKLAGEGFREVTLLGQNVNSYKDGDQHFADLLQAVSHVDGIDRIRFTSPHPKDFSDAMMDQMAHNPKVCKHMHLPMQAGNDRVLDVMRRHYTHEEFAQLVQRARERVPGIGFSTDIIVGFPTETAEEFEDTLRLVEKVRFESAFTFEYSPREGAPSARWEDDVTPVEKNRRLRELVALQQSITMEKAAECVGRSFEVLLEGPSRKQDSELVGRSSCNRVVVVPEDPRWTEGTLVTVAVDRAVNFTLKGCVTAVEGIPLERLPADWKPRPRRARA
ncbi:MAG: tRNA (N6-isopentenyl adenosine(37)-C2)-methylthiotransferase MiaB [Candidatus Cloacimonetes bacterium]|nr:tRNA (N6-isopentenyl adenosine(37)-C2)-methylthiotransferase MiaB [Candidatus Cloacimonadota bacterium]